MRAADDFATIRARMAELDRERRPASQRREDEEAHAEADRRSAHTLNADLKARAIGQNRPFRLG
jgi:hypothetical protein